MTIISAVGSVMPMTHFNGVWTACLDAGVLTFSDVVGSPTVDGEGWDQYEWDLGGSRGELRTGSRMSFGDDTVMTWANNERRAHRAHHDGDVPEVLVSWLTSPCGPRATIDIGQAVSLEGRDVAAIKVTQKTRSCDSAGMDAIVALRFRGPWTDVQTIDGRIVHR